MKISDYFSWIVLVAFFGYFSLRLLVPGMFPIRAELQPIQAFVFETAPEKKSPKVIKKKTLKVSWCTVCSWYGEYFDGKLMACGLKFDMNNPKHAANRILPFGTKVRITNLANNKELTVIILDRGPYIKDKQGNYTREFDLSYAGAYQLGFIEDGLAKIRVEII